MPRTASSSNDRPPETEIFSKPFALAMGPQRAGTSWLDRYLRARGDVCLPANVKEVFFFDRFFERGPEHYKSHYNVRDHHEIVMEISTTSFDSEDAPADVRSMMGENIVLLCPLRHPVRRSYSLYLHYLRYGIVQGDLKSAIEDVPQIIESSRYAFHLDQWKAHFPDTPIHICFQEDLEKDQEAYVRNICQILGIAYQEPEKALSQRYNVTTFSRSGTIAGLAQKGADFLRAKGFYAVINLAKSMGLKRLIFGREKPDAHNNKIPHDDWQYLQGILATEIEKFEEWYGQPVPAWHEDK